MPVRRRGPLVAGLGGLLSLCLMAGCQSGLLQKDGSAVQGPAVVMGLPRIGQMPMTAANGEASPAAVLEPVAGARPLSGMETDNTSVPVASWRFADHIGTDTTSSLSLPPRGAVSQVSGYEGIPPTSAPPELAPPGPLPVVVNRPPPIDEPSALPMPRPVPAAVPAAAPPTAIKMTTPPPGPPLPTAPIGFASGHGLPREGAKQALPPYVVEPPDILLIQASSAVLGSRKYAIQPLEGSHLVRPDGTVDLGIYGQVFVAGMTLADIKDVIARQLMETGAKIYREMEKNEDGTIKLKDNAPIYTGKVKTFTLEQIKEEVRVDVIGYNSKWYYIITSGAGWGEAIYKVPITGNETVLDAFAQIQGLPVVASMKKVYLSRPTNDPNRPMVVNIDYRSITKLGMPGCNYQLFPNDRLYIGSDPWLKADGILAKRFAPIERILGITLLGSSTVNSITGRFGQ